MSKLQILMSQLDYYKSDKNKYDLYLSNISVARKYYNDVLLPKINKLESKQRELNNSISDINDIIKSSTGDKISSIKKNVDIVSEKNYYLTQILILKEELNKILNTLNISELEYDRHAKNDTSHINSIFREIEIEKSRKTI